MTGKTVLITGATSGIGLQAARQLAALGAHVVVGARNAERGRATVAELVAAGGRASLLPIDVASFASIRRAAAAFAAQQASLDVLVNNAGIAAGKRATSADGFELTWATNVLGLALVTRTLLPLLEKAPEPRIVNVSSEAHRYGRIQWDDYGLERARYSGLKAYAQSKLAVNLYTRELARRYPNVWANAVHPGAIATKIWGNAPAFVQAILFRVLPPPERGAIPLVRLASSDDVRGISGRYFNKLIEIEPSLQARNDADARRLWDVVEATIS